MANWKLSAGAERLRKEINILFPHRDKGSDGSVGDSAHSSRTSDHNPDKNGWVRAIDVDEDVWGKDGKDPVEANRLVRTLIQFAKNGESRLKYIIFEGHIWSQTYKWSKRVYDGSNPHNHHIHISFNESADEDGSPFGLVAELKDEMAEGNEKAAKAAARKKA